MRMNKGFSTYYIYRRMQNNGMTAVVQPIEGLAKESVHLIHRLIGGRIYQDKNVVLDVELRKGDTTVI